MTTRHYIREWAQTDVLWMFDGQVQSLSVDSSPPEPGQIAIEFARCGWRMRFVVESVTPPTGPYGYCVAYLRRPKEYE